MISPCAWLGLGGVQVTFSDVADNGSITGLGINVGAVGNRNKNKPSMVNLFLNRI